MKAKPSFTDAVSERRNYVEVNNIRAICPNCHDFSLFAVQRSDEFPNARKIDGVLSANVPVRTVIFGCSLCPSVVYVVFFGNGGCKVIWPRDSWPDRAPELLRSEEKYKSIRDFYDQARGIMADSPAAAALLIRRCLQETLEVALGYEHDGLKKQLKKAIADTQLDNETRLCLNTIRIAGNWAGHPIEDDGGNIFEVELPEAEDAMFVLESLFDELFVRQPRMRSLKVRIESRHPKEKID